VGDHVLFPGIRYGRFSGGFAVSGGGFWLNTFIKTQAEFGDPVSRIMKRDGWVLTNANAMLLALPPISILKVDNSARRDPNAQPV